MPYLACNCLDIDAIDKYNGHTTICIFRLCQSILAESCNQNNDSKVYITKTKPMLMFLVECLRNYSQNTTIARKIVDVLICQELWMLNDEDITQLLLKGMNTVLTQHNRRDNISPSIFIEFCVSKVKMGIDVPTMGLLQLLSEHDVTKDVVLRQYGTEVLTNIVYKLNEWARNAQKTSVTELLRQKMFAVLTNYFKREEPGIRENDSEESIRTFRYLNPYWKDLMSATILSLDATKNIIFKCCILDFVSVMCQFDVFVLKCVELQIKDEPLILELLCVCKRMIQEKNFYEKGLINNVVDTTVTDSTLRIKVLKILIDVMKMYGNLLGDVRHMRKISAIPEYILRSDIVFFVKNITLVTTDIELFSASVEFVSLLSCTPTFSSSPRMLEVLESSLGTVYMISSDINYNPQIFIRFAINILKQHAFKQDFGLRGLDVDKEPTLKLQEQIIGLFSTALSLANKSYLLQYAKLLSFCSSSKLRNSLWGFLVNCATECKQSPIKCLDTFKTLLIIVDVLMKWNSCITVFGVHHSYPDLRDKSLELNITEMLNCDILAYALALIEIANPENSEDSVYIDIMMKLLLLSVQLRGFKECEKETTQNQTVKVLVGGNKGNSVEVNVPKAAETSDEITVCSVMSYWTADSLMSVLELFKSKRRLSIEWFEIMAYVVVGTVKSQIPWFDVEKDLSFFHGWKLFDAVKGLSEFTNGKTCDEEINEIFELARGKIIACGMAELAVIYVTEMLSPVKRNRDYCLSNLTREDGFVVHVLKEDIPQDYILFFYKTFLFTVAHWDPMEKEALRRYFPNFTENFTDIVSRMQSSDIRKIVTFNSSFFRLLFQENSISEFMMAKLIEEWMTNSSVAAITFLKEIHLEAKQLLTSADVVESCMMRICAFGESSCSNIMLNIFMCGRKVQNLDNLLNFFTIIINELMKDDKMSLLTQEKGESIAISNKLLNIANIMKLITFNANERSLLNVTPIFCEDLVKTTVKYYKYHNIGELGLTLINLCKGILGFRSVILKNSNFVQFLEKRLTLRKSISKETQLVFDIMADIVKSDAENNSSSFSSVDDQMFKIPAAPNPKCISWKLISVLPKLVYCGFAISPVRFITSLLKQNLKSSFVKVEELISTDSRELSDILANIYLYVHDMLQTPLEPETEDSLWEAAYQILRYTSNIVPKVNSGENEDIKQHYFLWSKIGENVWARLSLSLKLVQIDDNDLSTWPENFLWFTKQWLAWHHTVSKNIKTQQKYFVECYQDHSFVKLLVNLFKKFSIFDDPMKLPGRNTGESMKKPFLAHHIFIYCVLLLRKFLVDIPKGQHLVFFERNEQVVLQFIRNVDLQSPIYQKFKFEKPK